MIDRKIDIQLNVLNIKQWIIEGKLRKAQAVNALKIQRMENSLSIFRGFLGEDEDEIKS